MNDNPDPVKPTLWSKVQPWITYGPVAAFLMTLSVLLTNGLQYWMQGLVRDAEISGAKVAATLSMAGQCKATPVPVQETIEQTARQAAVGASTICTQAIEAAAKKPASVQRRVIIQKPKETGSLW